MRTATLLVLAGLLLPGAVYGQVNSPDSLRRAQFDLLKSAQLDLLDRNYESAESRLEGLLHGDLAPQATLYLGFIQDESGARDSARALIQQTLMADFALDIELHRAYIGDEYIQMFTSMRDELADRNPAYVTVAAHPWMSVAIDDEERGATPLRNYALRPGRHTIALSRDGYRRQTEVITLAPGARQLVGPIVPVPRTDTTVEVQRPLHALSARNGWSLRAILALDSGDTETSQHELGPEPETDSLRATWFAIQGIGQQLDGATDLARESYQRAIESNPSLVIGPDDLNPAVAGFFAASREQMIPTASFLALGPESIQVNREELYLRLTTRRTSRISAQLRELGTGIVVWRVDTVADSLMAIRWGGRRAAELGGGPVPSSRYELVVQPSGLAGLLGTGFTKLVDIKTAVPDTSPDLGEIPDSLLVKETRGGGARVASVLQGLMFGIAAGGLAYAADVQWDLPGLDPASGAVAIGSVTAALGIVGAIVLSTNRPVPSRAEHNARARAAWEKQRQQLRDLNRLRLTRPYLMVVRIAQ